MKAQRPSQAHGEAILDGERPTDASAARLYDLANRARARAVERDAERRTGSAAPEAESDGNAAIAGAEGSVVALPVTGDAAARKARSLEQRLREASRDLAFDAQGRFASYSMRPQSEFPTRLTRLPIFRPSQRRTQRALQDDDNMVAFSTPFGRGKRSGPPLTVRDEDTLIALMRLRDQVLAGRERDLPDNVRELYRDDGAKAEVHRVVCTVQQVNDALGLTDSGTNFANTLASIKRLAHCSIELERDVVEEGRSGTYGSTFRLLVVRWLVYEEHGLVDVVFPPTMAQWLKESYTYIDWNTRRQLSALGKAIHRYLSGQPRDYTIELGKLAATIGYDGRREHMRKKFADACEELVTVGWLCEYRISGSGRSTPLKLRTVRT